MGKSVFKVSLFSSGKKTSAEAPEGGLCPLQIQKPMGEGAGTKNASVP